MVKYLNKDMRQKVGQLGVTSAFALDLAKAIDKTHFGADTSKYLKTAATFFDKAYRGVVDALNDEERLKLIRSLTGVNLVFVTKSMMKQDEPDAVTIHVDVVRDMAEDVIDTVCKSCTREDFTDCKIRKCFHLTEVEPCDCAAEGKCQYKEV